MTAPERLVEVMARVTVRCGAPDQVQLIPPNTLVALAHDEARDLIRAGLVTSTSAPTVSPSPTSDRDAVVDAIADLDVSDFDSQGLPSCEALAAILAQPVSVQCRDDAWQVFQSLIRGADKKNVEDKTDRQKNAAENETGTTAGKNAQQPRSAPPVKTVKARGRPRASA